MRILASFLCFGLALVGCGDDDGPPGDGDGGPGDDAGGADGGVEPPPEQCAAFTAPGPGPRFRDVTGGWGLGPDGLDVEAGRVSIADLDGDGYPDVVVHRGGSHDRADFTAPYDEWQYHVLMNVEAGGGRELADRTVESNYGALREPEPDTGRAAHLAVFADLDDDGDVDAYSGTYGDPTSSDTDPGDRSEILLNDGTGTFELGPRPAAIAGSEDGSRIVPTTAATLLDYDRDGLVDVFTGYWYASYGRSLWGVQDRLSRNTGGGAFEDVTDAEGLGTLGSPGERDASRPTYGVTACDVDQDGDSDLLVSAYGRQWNQLWLRQDDGFVEVGETSGFDGDERTDYSDNEFYRCFCQTTGSCDTDPPRIRCDRLLWNEGTDDQPFRLNGNTFSTACGDVDSDGDMDLYNAEIVHWHIGSSSDPSELQVNTGPDADGVPVFDRPGNDATGLSVPHVGTSWNEGGISSGLADLDNDGRMDALLGTSDYPDQRLWIYHQQPDGSFAETAVDAGVDHACAPGFGTGDLDRDGDLDLVVTSSTARDCSDRWPDGPKVRIYENVGGQDANWTQIHLEGAGAEAGGANRSAVGALVRVEAGGGTRTREVQAGYGHFGLQRDLDVTVGLGETCAIDAIEVRWPDADGTVERFEDVRANYRLVIRQGEGLTYRE